ncbi:hypothetical protein APSETT444_008635 [Aspergillus pseudonomiae]
MATHVLTATTSPTNQISVYGQPSPINTANNSPTSPRQQYLPLQTRQLRPPKGPLYVPAALRPTERPQKTSPPSPPRSIHGSLDSLNDGSEEPQPALTRRSTIESAVSDGISKLAQDEWMKHEHLGEVTGLPTRDHWKDARFHPEGVPSRACDLCWHAFQRWEESRSERLNKIQTLIEAQNIKTEEAAEETTEHVDNIEEESRKALTAMLGQSTEIAASIPRGWNWSTF